MLRVTFTGFFLVKSTRVAGFWRILLHPPPFPQCLSFYLIIKFDQPLLVAGPLPHVGLPQPAITLICSTIIIGPINWLLSIDSHNQLIVINLSSWILICIEILTIIPMKLWCQIWQRHLIEALDDVLKPSALQLLPDPVGHVETDCLKG